ncbi:hypothetical protein AHAS_Ahas11G0249400 [Arachis hypogaea]
MEIYGVTAVPTFSRQDHAAHVPPLDWFLDHRLYLRSARILDLRFYIVSYDLGIYMLNLLIGFLSPQVDPEIQELYDSTTLPSCQGLR